MSAKHVEVFSALVLTALPAIFFGMMPGFVPATVPEFAWWAFGFYGLFRFHGWSQGMYLASQDAGRSVNVQSDTAWSLIPALMLIVYAVLWLVGFLETSWFQIALAIIISDLVIHDIAIYGGGKNFINRVVPEQYYKTMKK